MEVMFREKFKEILKEELSDSAIDWSLVEIKYVHYNSQLIGSLPVELNSYVVRMRVLELDGEIRNIDVDEWFRSHKFIYSMISKDVNTEFEDIDVMNFDTGTIESIATKIRDAFRNFHG